MEQIAKRAGLPNAKVEKHFPSRLVLSSSTNGHV
jgi:hypothetical protein